MDKTVLYLQPSPEISKQIADRLLSSNNGIELFTARTAEEAFTILDELDIALLIADCYVEDMKLYDFINTCGKKYPQVLVNVCIDTNDISAIARFAGMDCVTKIYLYPWDMGELIDGALESIDRACIKRDYVRRINALNEDKAQFEVTINSLKKIMEKQHYSYSKLKMVLEPFIEEAVKIKEDSPEISEREIQGNYFIRKCCNKLLKIMTTSRIDYESFSSTVRNEIINDTAENRHIEIGDVYSCLSENTTKDKLGLVLFVLWMLAMYTNDTFEKAEINISSQYDSSSLCRFVLAIKGEKSKADEYLEGYIKHILDCFAAEYQIHNMDGEIKYSLDFEV